MYKVSVSIVCSTVTKVRFMSSIHQHQNQNVQGFCLHCVFNCDESQVCLQSINIRIRMYKVSVSIVCSTVTKVRFMSSIQHQNQNVQGFCLHCVFNCDQSQIYVFNPSTSESECHQVSVSIVCSTVTKVRFMSSIHQHQNQNVQGFCLHCVFNCDQSKV